MTTRTKQVVLSPKSLTSTPTANSKSRDELIWDIPRKVAGGKNLISCGKSCYNFYAFGDITFQEHHMLPRV